MRKLRFMLIIFGILFISISLTSCKYKNKRSKYKTFELGFYPQDVLTDQTIVDELDKLTNRNSLGYYEYNGVQYAKLKCNPQYETDTLFRTTKTKVRIGEERYFIVSPITWRILENTDDYLLLTTEYILFTRTFINRSNVKEDTYANNYAESDVRKYLNNEFYNIYLESNEAIMETEWDNSYLSVGDGIEDNKYLCENTTDYVSLISSADQDNKEYGFTKKDDRYAFASDYLIAQGASTNQESPNSFYFAAIEFYTRSPWPFDDEIDDQGTSIDPSEVVYCIDDHGLDNRTTVFAPRGIRPCIKVDKSKLI